MLTQQFKTTLGVVIGVAVAGVLFTNQMVQDKKIKVLQDEQMTSVKSEQASVSATPTATPAATLTPTVSYQYKTIVPTKGVTK